METNYLTPKGYEAALVALGRVRKEVEALKSRETYSDKLCKEQHKLTQQLWENNRILREELDEQKAAYHKLEIEIKELEVERDRQDRLLTSLTLQHGIKINSV